MIGAWRSSASSSADARAGPADAPARRPGAPALRSTPSGTVGLPPPVWLEASGAWISIFFLTLLGVLDLRAVFTAAPDEVVAPVGLKGRFLGRLAEARSPWVVLLVGAAFALSFDTVSQAALFAATGAHFGGLQNALALGALFLLACSSRTASTACGSRG